MEQGKIQELNALLMEMQGEAQGMADKVFQKIQKISWHTNYIDIEMAKKAREAQQDFFCNATAETLARAMAYGRLLDAKIEAYYRFLNTPVSVKR